MITKIISGGQTGADQGALEAAARLGLATGGMMPQGWRTEAGPRPDLAALYSLQEHSSPRYALRTQNNILMSDATLLLGNITSKGSAMTKHCVDQYKKPFYHYPWFHPLDLPQFPDRNFEAWLVANKVEVLNVAGNRESQNQGIFYATKCFLLVNLAPLLRRARKEAETNA